VLWEDGDDQLMVHVGKVFVSVRRGLVVVSIPVACDQTGSATVQVPFAIGDEERPAGLLVATGSRPHGPAAVVDVWGEALTAFAWQTLLTVLTRLAFQAGTDKDATGLIPIAVEASDTGLNVRTLARHAFDRISR
jgi:hypothetical protein